MVRGFEDITKELTQKELKAARKIANALRGRMGVKNAITNKEMMAAMESYGMPVDSTARMRKIIQYIRITGLVKGLCSSSKGYWKAATKDELHATFISMIERIKSQQETAASIKRDLDTWT